VGGGCRVIKHGRVEAQKGILRGKKGRGDLLGKKNEGFSQGKTKRSYPHSLRRLEMLNSK